MSGKEVISEVRLSGFPVEGIGFYGKLAASYLALVKLAAIRIWLPAYKSTP